MTDKQTYAFMAAAAYDERRGSANDDHVMAIESYLDGTMGWTKDDRDIWDNPDGASYSDPATGMQADVWTKGSNYVIASQSSVNRRANGNALNG